MHEFWSRPEQTFQKDRSVAYCSNGLQYICPRKDLLWRSRKKVYDPPPPENWDGNSKDRFCWMILSIYVDRGSSQFGQWPGVRMYIYIYLSIYLYICMYLYVYTFFIIYNIHTYRYTCYIHYSPVNKRSYAFSNSTSLTYTSFWSPRPACSPETLAKKSQLIWLSFCVSRFST